MKHHFTSLNSLLLTYQDLWRFEPFLQSVDEQLPWILQYPQLCQWLYSLTYEQIDAYKADSESLLTAITRVLPELAAIKKNSQLAKLTLSGLNLERGVESGVPGRKLEQVVSMGEAALKQHEGQEWLEWCSGKGFLGRILASQSQQQVTSFEFQQALCDAGQSEANKQKLPMTFIQGDALAESAKRAMNSRQHAVALHACGDLHVSLIKKASNAQLPAMTISPCCYHLIEGENYQPLSSLGQSSELTLSKAELRIPLQETVTGGERVKRHRFEEMSFRLGLDLLLRQACGFEHYLPIPSIKKSSLADGFQSFCLWATKKKQIELPEVDFLHFQQLGEQRYWHMERLSLVQQVFRRSLELWLVLDKSLYIEEQGYQVDIVEFCAKEVTPRNILICATKT
jgi:hypothetical protein